MYVVSSELVYFGVFSINLWNIIMLLHYSKMYMYSSRNVSVTPLLSFVSFFALSFFHLFIHFVHLSNFLIHSLIVLSFIHIFSYLFILYSFSWSFIHLLICLFINALLILLFSLWYNYSFIYSSSSSDNFTSEEEEEEDLDSESEENNSDTPKWALVCATSTEWEELAESFKKSKHRDEKLLYQTLSEDFVPEIEKMIEAKVSWVNDINYWLRFIMESVSRVKLP